MRQPASDPGEQLTGRELRSLTARATASRTGPGLGEVLTTVVYAIVCAAVTAGLVVGVADTLRDVVALPSTPSDGPATLSLTVVRWLLWVVLAAQAASLAARLGPVGVSGAGVRWWVPTAVDRAGLLVGSWWVSLGLWTAGTAAAALLVAVVTGMPLDDGGPWAVVTAGAGAGALIVSTAGILQVRGGAARTQAVSDAVSAAVPVLAVVALLVLRDRGPARPPAVLDLSAAVATSPVLPAGSDPGLEQVQVVLLVLLLLLATVAAVVWRRSLGRLSAAVLAARVGAAEHTGAAVLSLDTRELARALGRGRTVVTRRRSRRLALARGPASALLLGETLALLRTPGLPLGLLSLACAAVVAQQVPALSHGAGLAVVTLAVGVRAAQAGARGAQEADVVPALDSLLPLGARATRVLRTVLPAVTSALVLHVALVPVLVDAGSGAWTWSALLLLAGTGFGAAAVRGAFRRPPDWSAPLLATPAGALPTGAVSSALRGPDLALLVLVPLAVGVVLGAATGVLVLLQAVVAAVALVVASTVPRGR